jgi:hypothetical protein
MASLLSRPTLARRDAPFPNKAAADGSTGGVTFSPTLPELLAQFCPDRL